MQGEDGRLGYRRGLWLEETLEMGQAGANINLIVDTEPQPGRVPGPPGRGRGAMADVAGDYEATDGSRSYIWHSGRNHSIERAAGLPQRFRILDLRHTCASLLIVQGESPKAIQEYLGHPSIQVTMDRYGYLFPEETSGWRKHSRTHTKRH